MPIPFLLPLLLTAASIGANQIGSRKAESAHADANRAERYRQNKFDDEARALNNKSRDRYADIETQQDAKSTELADLFLEGADAAPAFGPAPSDDNITVQAESAAKAKSRAYTDQQGTARAKMLSLSDLFGDIGVEQAQDNNELNGIFGMKRGSQGVLPMELEAAANAGSGWRMAGDILGGAASVTGMGAMTGASLPGMGGIFASNAPKSAIPWLSKATNPGPMSKLGGLFKPLAGL